MFRIVLASAFALAASACSSNDPIANLIPPSTARVIPHATEFFPGAVVIAEPVVPVPEVAEVIPPYVPPVVYVDPGPQPSEDGCIIAWRHPCD